MEKKKNNKLVIVLLIIIILGLGGYIVYDKVLSKQFNNNVKDSKKIEKELSLVGTYNRGICSKKGEADCATLVITKQEDNSIYFELSAIKGIMEKGPNIGNLSGVANLDDDNKYKFYKNEYDTESTILFKFDEDKVTIEESYSTGNNPYGGHGIYFFGTYEKNKNQSTSEDNLDSSKLTVNESKYSSVIDEYSKAMKDDDFDNNSDFGSKYPYINETMMHYYHSYNSVDFNYLYYDINKDGDDELIVGDGDNNIFEIYTYKDKALRLFEDEVCLGERCKLKIWDNGTLYFEGSGGAFNHSYEFYKISNNGYNKETIKRYNVEYDVNDSNIFSVTDADTNKKVEFNSIDGIISSVKGNANDVDLSKLYWIKIK